jgi:4-carboxymuconolactone decarboxylase
VSTTKSNGQGFGRTGGERLPIIEDKKQDDRQRAVVKALMEGPRKGVYGPFVPLLRSPDLLDRVAKVGEYLRFESALNARVRELTTCFTARHVTNQFEWLMHAPLAIQAGVAQEALDAIYEGARPLRIRPDEEIGIDFARELLMSHGVSDLTYQAATDEFGEKGVVELTMLVGYFAMISWVMNVARTPAQVGAQGEPLAAFPQ